MAKLHEVYKCEICGNIIEVLHVGAGELVCCNKPMQLLKEKTNEEGLNEKHIPSLEIHLDKIIVKIGEVSHPMEENHFIEWIEVLSNKESYKHFLKPGDSPIAEFNLLGKNIKIRAYCNLHGLWSKEVK
jgi:superoxide reductase